MSEAVIGSSQWHSAHLRDMVQSVRKDIVYIFIGALLLGVVGTGVGKLTNTSTSCAQLVLTPMPLRAAKGIEDPLAVMMATPLDVTSLSMLCMGDEVLARTLTRVNESGQLSAPIMTIRKLKSRLSFLVTIAKETPYDLTYAPILELTAKCSVAADAPLLVNTWGAVVSEAATRFQDAVQKPAAEALDERLSVLGKELEAAEMESEKFWTENNIDYIKVRLEDIVGMINSIKKSRTELQCQLVGERANLESYTKAIAEYQPKITLGWLPSKPLLDILGSKIGVTVPKEDASKVGDALTPLLSSEHLNTIYWELKGKITAADAGVFSREAQLKEQDSLIEGLEKERLELQANYALTLTGKNRLGRKVQIVEAIYANIKSKHEYAQVAGQIKHPVLQVISQGSEWPLPRFRWMIMFGTVAFCVGLMFCTAFSVMYRMILQPALGR